MSIEPHCQGASGFTVVETLVVVTLIGILTAIVAPGWLAFVNRQRLSDANESVYLAFRTAQNRATMQKSIWQVSFREREERIEFSVHRADGDPVYWDSLSPQVRFDEDNTTLRESGGWRRVRFDERGRTHGQLGRVTLVSRDGDRNKRCTIVSTLLGVVRKAQDEHCDR
ncbi:prepilin-type N-terminal cleavage/methylation domain-containing protein [Baaleninema sp.]|uniref:prepilin-type N-terminal cleavage/methylation domain-containing protein n=1 Tax=Baaleninema sp. TaxID=3101197 RepID=UPI003CFBF343